LENNDTPVEVDEAGPATRPTADLKSLFDSINNEVADAVASLGTSISTPSA